MGRTIYNIRCKDNDGKVNIKQNHGYTFKVGEVRFGVTNTSPMPECNKYQSWYTTELYTGYRVGYGRTKQEAIDNILQNKDGVMEKIAPVIMNLKLSGMTDANQDTPITTTYFV